MSVGFFVERFMQNLSFDARWVTGRLHFTKRGRYRYLFDKYKSILSNKREIYYLGDVFAYDNRLAPALLQTYPFEISELAKHVDFSELKTVFDVGANVGQFAWTLKKCFPHLQVFSFEPNPVIFPLLQRNAATLKGWNAYNFGIGPQNTKIPFYFVPGKSGQGSVYKSNSTLNLQPQKVETLEITVCPIDTELMKREAIPAQFDLLKIDVEGYELEVLRGLQNVSWRFLFIEVSEGREGSVSIESIISRIHTVWNILPKLIWEDGPAGTSRNVLFARDDAK